MKRYRSLKKVAELFEILFRKQYLQSLPCYLKLIVYYSTFHEISTDYWKRGGLPAIPYSFEPDE